MFGNNIPLSLAALRGLTNVASEGAAKKEAEGAVKEKPIEITTKVDPATGDTTHNIKGISGKALEGGTAEQRTQAAYDAPQERFAEQVRSEVGRLYDIKPDAVTSQDTDSYRELYQLRRKSFGENPLVAGAKAGLSLLHVIPRGRVERDATAANQSQIAARTREQSPIFAEASRRETDAEQQTLYAKQALNAANDAIAKTTATDGMTLEDYYKSIADQANLPELSTAQQARAGRKYRQDIEKTRQTKVESIRKDKAALGQLPTFEDVRTSLGAKMTPDEEKQVRVDWAAAREATLRARQDQQMQRERQDAFIKKLSKTTEEKPLALTVTEGRQSSVGDLEDLLRDQRVRKSTVERALKRKPTEMARESEDIRAKARVLAAKIEKAKAAAEDPSVEQTELDNLIKDAERIDSEIEKLRKLGYVK